MRKILLLILFTILIGCSWTTSTAYLCGSNIYADEYLTRQYLPLKNLNLPDIKYIGSFFRFPDENGGFHYNWNSFIALSFMLILIVSWFMPRFRLRPKLRIKLRLRFRLKFRLRLRLSLRLRLRLRLGLRIKLSCYFI